jgi:iron(III) transport system ATP-binding protein
MDGLTLSGLTKAFGDVVAVDNVSLAIEEGELFFLLGPSGCGKTTLLRIIAGFCTPDSGQVRFRDADLLAKPIEKRGIGMVFQSYSLWPHMSVSDNVAYGLRMRGVDASGIATKVTRALEMVDMAGLGGRRPAELSGGQQQRVALARALVYEADMVLLDEPLSNLDAKLRKEMRREIRKIHERLGVTMVYVTHDQEEAATMADRVALLRDGRVLQVGTPRELYCHPASVFAAEFFGQANLVPGTVERAEGDEVLVRFADGELRAAAGSAQPRPEKGAAVTAMVRPENVRVATDARETNAFKARVVGREFSGAVETQTLALGSTRLVALSLSGAGSSGTDPGAVAVTIAPDAVHLIAQERG